MGFELTLANIMTGINAVTGVMSAFQAMQQGAAAESEAEIKSAQARAESERAAVNAEIEANNRVRKLKQINAAAVAQGFSGGVSGFSGSALLMQTVSEKYAGKDVQELQRTAKERRSFGEVQASMFEQAGEYAKSASNFNALSALANTAYSTYQLMPGGSTKLPSYGMAGSGTPRYGSTAYWKGTA